MATNTTTNVWQGGVQQTCTLKFPFPRPPLLPRPPCKDWHTPRVSTTGFPQKAEDKIAPVYIHCVASLISYRAKVAPKTAPAPGCGPVRPVSEAGPLTDLFARQQRQAKRKLPSPVHAPRKTGKPRRREPQDKQLPKPTALRQRNFAYSYRDATTMQRRAGGRTTTS